MKKGLVQIYTGNGKGKTTAALGLALRAAGAGLSVYVMQFLKSAAYSEMKTLKKLKKITAVQCGRGCLIKRKAKKIDFSLAAAGLMKARKIIMSGEYDVVILDEVNVALNLGLINSADITEIITRKPRGVELVLTGRYCPKSILKRADLITEMREVKHPYRKGLKARPGIEY